MEVTESEEGGNKYKVNKWKNTIKLTCGIQGQNTLKIINDNYIAAVATLILIRIKKHQTTQKSCLEINFSEQIL